jgi:hypothetical protein
MMRPGIAPQRRAAVKPAQFGFVTHPTKLKTLKPYDPLRAQIERPKLSCRPGRPTKQRIDSLHPPQLAHSEKSRMTFL